ncbi:MAG: alkaline phosphatase family protein [Planctomycetes bacterium]|nr:alkaline phosphatase family protein [Planctomycetota bacterium]
MRPVVLLNIVGLTPRQVGEHTPRIRDLAAAGSGPSPLKGVLPAVTCSAQATLLTGLLPQDHGVVGNGWFHRDTGEIRFWLQSNRLIAGEKIYEAARKKNPRFTCAKMFWWFNQGAEVDWSVTPKPHYGADGSKVFDVQSWPGELGAELEGRIGKFPFFSFWGPKSGLPSSEWIAKASADVIRQHKPTLTLVYLPHLDYDHQRFGPGNPALLREIDACAGLVIDAARQIGASVAIVSEYGIAPVSRALFPNRLLRQQKWLSVRGGPFGEVLDPFESKAFAVVDHQVAHVYVRDKASVSAVADRLREMGTPVAGAERKAIGLDCERAGDIVLLAPRDAWFAYDYWLDDRRAPDFARTVDIHRKPGYDPRELFAVAGAGPKVARRLIQKKLGMRYLMDVVPLDASIVKGSHGLEAADNADGPVWISSERSPKPAAMTEVKAEILKMMRL